MKKGEIATLIADFCATRLRNRKQILKLLKMIIQRASPEDTLILDYPITLKQRWSPEPHEKLYEIINESRNTYQNYLQAFLEYRDFFLEIPEHQPDNLGSTHPSWINGWMPALDGIALYSFLVINKPNIYLEVGSGNSTKFARRAITDHNLSTKIISIDPYPRAEIDAICDEVIRQPAESIDLEVFDQLGKNDILYIDNSHRVFMNSDVTAFFLDVLPRLKSDVYIEIHDIMLPYDYPANWIERYYSEQYLLAAYLLARGNLFDVILPNNFISNDKELHNILSSIWQSDKMQNIENHGVSFWLKMK
jgi:Methyltransferase domain